MANAVLTEHIRQVHADSHETYGMPRVRAELLDQGMTVSRKRVARLMRLGGIRGISRRRALTVTTRRDSQASKAPDLVQRRFAVAGPDRLWVADMRYVPTWAGFVYLAVVLDAWSRRVVGWAIGDTMTAELVLQALNMALEQRRPRDVIHHSDQGSQAFGVRRDDRRVAGADQAAPVPEHVRPARGVSCAAHAFDDGERRESRIRRIS